MRPVSELPAVFPCRGDSLVAIVHRPDQPGDTGVVIVAGGPQYRVGSHRQFVHLARALASGGYPVLRFDYRGMGDSTGDMRMFEAINDDIAMSIDALCNAVPQVQRIVLWGLCDAASAALLYCHAALDSRITGLCLANPWVRSVTSLARTHVKHYYGRRLMQRDFWHNLLAGRVGARALTEFMSNISRARLSQDRSTPDVPAFHERMAQAWFRFEGPVLLLLSAHDYTAQEFVEHVGMARAWQGALQRSALERRDLADADHTFSTIAARTLVEASTLHWLQRCFPIDARYRNPEFAGMG